MQLSILMPSNRNWAESRKAIESALAFCDKQDACLIVSDNSRDPQKRRQLARASRRLVYIEPEHDGLQANLLNVYAAARTEFILMMGDDDQLFASPKDKPLDLARLGADHIGTRPLVAVANSAGKVIRVKDFGITGETPASRVMFYNAHAKGDNAAYYSIFRRGPFVDLHRYFFEHHPLKGGYSDWALACVMFACGKLAHDPGVIYKYNYHQWDDELKIDRQRRGLFEAAGLPGDAERYGLLLLYLDMLILGCRTGSPLSKEDKRNLAVEAGLPILDGFRRKVTAEPDIFGARTVMLAGAMGLEVDADARFDLALRMTEQILPGLEARYRAFSALSAGDAVL